jgi:hypothetical protein
MKALLEQLRDLWNNRHFWYKAPPFSKGEGLRDNLFKGEKEPLPFLKGD